MFDQSKEFVLKILSGGEKICTVRYPTDAEWCERVRKSKTVRTYLGRDKQLVDRSASERADAELLAKIRVDGGEPAFDKAEAYRAMGRLDRAQLLSVERAGDQYRVAMRVPGADVVHILRMPTAGDALEYERSTTKVSETRNRRESAIDLENLAAIYDRLRVSVEGYAGNVPVNHKGAAVVDVMDAYERDSESEEDLDPEAA